MDVFYLLHRPSDREQLQRLQTICCRYLAPYGLSLHPTQLQALLQSQRESLLQAGPAGGAAPDPDSRGAALRLSDGVTPLSIDSGSGSGYDGRRKEKPARDVSFPFRPGTLEAGRSAGAEPP